MGSGYHRHVMVDAHPDASFQEGPAGLPFQTTGELPQQSPGGDDVASIQHVLSVSFSFFPT